MNSLLSIAIVLVCWKTVYGLFRDQTYLSVEVIGWHLLDAVLVATPRGHKPRQLESTYG
jgi:hypothetical protein